MIASRVIGAGGNGFAAIGTATMGPAAMGATAIRAALGDGPAR